ncbi:hypothetical protein [Pseudopedobacter beijingensis]|uniref:NACHT domain-containing protein n=1 Tax=Pseudopedobacter beijingensis TaxID=1207056 RepID=A0ABW4IFW4_9SPHI
MKASISALTPSDCRRLSVLINKAVHKNVSETTLKRLFGFAETKHKFSRYTITALCEFIGKQSWEQFCEESKKTESIKNNVWNVLQSRARLITRYTLNNIKNKCSIPFPYTINREFSERDFNYFYNKEFVYSSFVSQAGFGKSVMLAHLVEKFFITEGAPYQKDILLFINPNMLPGLENLDYNIEQWLDEQMDGISTDSFSQYFNDHPEELEGKIIIIFDGFDDITLKDEPFNKLINSLADFVSLHAKASWIKIVLSMRTTMWLKFYEKIRHSAIIKSKWYKGNYSANDDFSNLPPLTDREIDFVIQNFSPEKIEDINPKIKMQLKSPFYLHIYYDLLQDGRDAKCLTDLTFYELIVSFVHHKINLSSFYTEKVILLKNFINIASKNQKGNAVYKVDILNDIVKFKQAYDELILHGILVEEKQYGDVLPVEIVRFQQTHVFEYFLFIETIEKHDRKVNSEYLRHVLEEFENSNITLKLLQWTVRYVVINDHEAALIDIIRMKLPVEEKKYLLFFIAEMLESKTNEKADHHFRINSPDVHNVFLQELLNFDFTDFYYKNTLKSLALASPVSENKLIYMSLLAYVYFFELDILQLREIFGLMQELSNFDSAFTFSQINAVELILSSLSLSLDDTADELKLANFMKGKDYFEQLFEEFKPKAIISYLSFCIVSILYGKVGEFVQLNQDLYKKHPHIVKGRSGFSLYVLIVSAFVNLSTDSGVLKKLLRHISLVKNNIGDGFHSFFYVMLCMLMTIHNKLLSNNEQAAIYMEEGVAISELKKIHSFETIFLMVAVNIYGNMGDIDKAEKMSYKLHCLLEEKRISTTNLIGFFKGVRLRDNNLFIK